MKILWIYDHHSGLKPPGINTVKEVALFPLTGDASETEKIINFIEQHRHCNIYTIPSAELIHQASLLVKEHIASWSANIGNTIFNRQKIKEWLFDSRLGTSTWWFGILSGKNTFQSEAFLNLAQANAIHDHIKAVDYEYLIVQVRNKKLCTAIKCIAQSLCIKAVYLQATQKLDVKTKLIGVLSRYTLIEAFAHGILQIYLFLYIHFQTKKGMPPIEKRNVDIPSTILISPIPGINKKKLKTGEHINSYFIGLQDKFRMHGESVTWLFHYVGNPDRTLHSALHDIAHLFAMGEKCFFIHEFFSLKLFCIGIAAWIKQSLLGLYLYRRVRSKLFQKPARQESEIILKYLWYESLLGGGAIEGIFFGLAFKSFFETLSTPERIIYCTEMRTWEKALVAVCSRYSPKTQTIGFQHAAISSSYYHFFYDPDELNSKIRKCKFPMPTILALTGKKTRNLLSRCQFPNIKLVEANRFLYINNILSKPLDFKNKNKILLVAGSISKSENRTLVSLVHKAFPSNYDFEIWFKPHPHCLFDDIFNDLKIDTSKSGYKITKDEISSVLGITRAVIVPTSTVSIEALAYGCKVFIPVVPDGLLMNPLSDFSEFYQTITTPEQLKSQIEDIMVRSPEIDMDTDRRFIRDYWYTDPELPRWEDLLWSR